MFLFSLSPLAFELRISHIKPGKRDVSVDSKISQMTYVKNQ